MESEGSITYSQQPVTLPYPPYFFKIHFKIIQLSTRVSPKW